MERVKTGVTKKAKVGAGEATARTSMGVVVGAGTLLGAWGVTCFLSALVQNGLGGMVRGLFTALGG